MFKHPNFDGITPPTQTEMARQKRKILTIVAALWTIPVICLLIAVFHPLHGLVDILLNIAICSGLVAAIVFSNHTAANLEDFYPLVASFADMSDITFADAERFFRENPQYAPYLYQVRAQGREFVRGDIHSLLSRERMDEAAASRKRFEEFTV